MEVDQFTVKEILVQMVLPRLEEISAVNKQQTDELQARVDKLESWRDRFLGMVALITAIVLPVAVPVIVATVQVHGA